MNSKNEERKKQVAHIIEIPDEYHLVVDDQKTVDDPFHVLFWEHQDDAEKNIRISVNRHTGELIELDIDDEGYFQIQDEGISEEKAKEIAHLFVRKHILNEYANYTYVYVRDWCGMPAVHYLQEVNGYPLPNTECVVRVHPSGNVVAFQHYHGLKEKPIWPESIVDEKIILEELKNRQNMRLVFAHLLPETCQYENGKEVNGYRLVYEPDPSVAFIDASTGKDLYGSEHYQSPPTVAVSAPENKDKQETNVFRLLALDEKQFVKIFEDESDNKIRMKFVRREELESEQEENQTYLMDDFYKKHSPMMKYENPMLIEIDKESGTLLNYFNLASGGDRKVILSREECLEKVLQFLTQVIPNMEEHLRLWDNYNEEESPGRFFFGVYVNEIPVEVSLGIINIDTETGEVLMYSGISPRVIEELSTYETSARVRKEQALAIYRNALRVELQWHENNDIDTPKYDLIYKQTTTESSETYHIDFFMRREIRYIDAHTGEAIWSK
ncbi:YcdB/YcdC domain-containing protein [Bacillus cereus]|uniref:YcdB/YcdC domain-containing protein n=1 Tax=Bacillus cereus TaxID=1396 RepID=UPI003980E6E5